jgi:hypothetical protein
MDFVTFPSDSQVEYIGKSTEEFDSIRRGVDILRMSRNVRNLVEFRWGKDNDLYDSKFDKKEIAFSEMLGVPRLFIPKTYAQVQRIMEECLETWFFDFEEICTIRSWKSVPRETLDIVKALLNYRLNGHPINAYQEIYEFVQDAIKNKVGILKIYPRFKVIKSKIKGVRTAFMVDEDGKTVEPPDPKDLQKVIQFFTPVVECVPYEDLFFHYESTWKNYWQFPVVHRVKRTRDYCKRRGYKNVDLIPWAGTIPGTDLIKNQRNLNQGSPFAGAPEDIQELQTIWVYECWDLQPKGNDDHLISGSFVLGGSAERPMAELRGWVDNNLPYQFDPTEPVRPPFVVATSFPESHSMYGKSFPEVTEGLQKETNARFNQEREAVARALRPPTLVNKNANIDLMALKLRKIGGVVQGNDISPEGIREMEMSNPVAISLPAQQRTDALYSEISSVSPESLGVNSQSNDEQAATTSNILASNSSKKTNMVIRNIALTGLVPLFQMLLRLEQEYESDVFIEQVTGRTLGWKFVKDDDGNYVGTPPSLSIQGDFDFMPALGQNKQQQMALWKTLSELGNQANAQMGQLLQIGAIHAQNVRFFNPQIPFEQISKMLGYRNIDEMKLPSMQPPPPQQGQGGGKGNPSPPGVSGPMSPAQQNLLAPV